MYRPRGGGPGPHTHIRVHLIKKTLFHRDVKYRRELNPSRQCAIDLMFSSVDVIALCLLTGWFHAFELRFVMSAVMYLDNSINFYYSAVYTRVVFGTLDICPTTQL